MGDPRSGSLSLPPLDGQGVAQSVSGIAADVNQALLAPAAPAAVVNQAPVLSPRSRLLRARSGRRGGAAGGGRDLRMAAAESRRRVGRGAEARENWP